MEETILASDFGICFTLTNRLRWIIRKNKEQPTFNEHEMVLQQMWQGSDGSQRWEDVEIIK